MAQLYSLLFALSLTLMNPNGFYRSEIWIPAKLLVITLIIALNLGVLVHHWYQETITPPFVWKVGFALWAGFLSIGLAATLASPFPGRSLWGQPTLGDGWIYWVLLATFVLSNALVLRLQPTLVRSQFYGLIAGGVIVALSFLPPVRQIPLSLYSNRGHAAFVLAAVAILALLGALWGWVQPLLAGVVSLILSGALLYTHVRGGILALLVAVVYLLGRYSFTKLGKRLKQLFLIGLFAVSSFFSYWIGLTATPTVDSLQKLSTGRLHLWELALQGIAERPLLGWGFDGFGIAFPFIGDWVGKHREYLRHKVDIVQVLKLNDSTFNYLGTDGRLHTGLLMNNKAHNLLLDTALSVGILGLIVYILLLGCCGWWAARTAFWGIEAIAIAYLVYTFTWYESAQFTHLAWWSLSIGLSFPPFDKSTA